MIKALILTGDGINCEEETAFALQQAGAEPTVMLVNELIDAPERLHDFQILALPGGFSFGDDVASGKILALKLQYGLADALTSFIERDTITIGICNGFQTLVRMGLLPHSEPGNQQVTLTHNKQHRFINRWVTLQAWDNCQFFAGLQNFMLPIRHGEGRLILSDEDHAELGEAIRPFIALTYTEDVNGSYLQTAALANDKGNVLGLMPHPEAFVRWTQHPSWTSLSDEEKAETPAGLKLFQNLIHILEN